MGCIKAAFICYSATGAVHALARAGPEGVDKAGAGTADVTEADLDEGRKMSAEMTKPQLAEVLFASTLQESDRPTPAEVRMAVSRMLARDHGTADCLAYLAQEAGDHPETYVARMRWALRAVEIAYAAPPQLAAAA